MPNATQHPARLTRECPALTDKLVTLHVESERRILSSLTQAEQKGLNRLLGKLVKGLGEVRSS